VTSRTLARIAPILACVLLASCGAQPAASPNRSDARLFERADLAMGSELKLTAWSNDEASVQKLFDQVFARFDRLDAMMSVWLPIRVVPPPLAVPRLMVTHSRITLLSPMEMLVFSPL